MHSIGPHVVSAAMLGAGIAKSCVGGVLGSRRGYQVVHVHLSTREQAFPCGAALTR